MVTGVASPLAPLAEGTTVGFGNRTVIDQSLLIWYASPAATGQGQAALPGLTVLGVVIGIAAVTTMVSIGQGATQLVQKQFQNLGRT